MTLRQRSPWIKELTLAASRRYYPGFFGALFLILLRLAIGWHFAAEGVFKIMSTPEAKNSFLARIFPVSEGPTFTSEEYLRASTGPLSETFRQMVPDVESRDKLKPSLLKDTWAEEKNRVSQHFGFDEEQRAAADKLLKAKGLLVDDYFIDRETEQKIRKYFDEIADVATIDRNPDALSYERERANEARRRLETDRKGLVKPINAWQKELYDSWIALAKKTQVESQGEYIPPRDELAKIDRLTMFGTTAVGVCLMLGLFTPLAGLGGAGFLLLVYLSMPPLPGLPLGPRAEGHYVFVNKNLVELFACLVIAATPSGLWFGFDAFLFGWINRIGQRPELDADSGEDLSDQAVSRTSQKSRRR